MPKASLIWQIEGIWDVSNCWRGCVIYQYIVDLSRWLASDFIEENTWAWVHFIVLTFKLEKIRDVANQQLYRPQAVHGAASAPPFAFSKLHWFVSLWMINQTSECCKNDLLSATRNTTWVQKYRIWPPFLLQLSWPSGNHWPLLFPKWQPWPFLIFCILSRIAKLHKLKEPLHNSEENLNLPPESFGMAVS